MAAQRRGRSGAALIGAKIHQRPLALGAYGLALLLLAGAGWHAWQVIGGGAHGRAPDGSKAQAGQSRAQARAVDVGEIVAAHLFGAAPAAQVAAAPEAQVPETRLKLTLYGVAASDTPRYARAIIAVERGEARSYGPGERVDQTDAEIRAIRPDHVLLSRRGALESLYLVKPEPGSGSGAETTTAPAPTPLFAPAGAPAATDAGVPAEPEAAADSGGEGGANEAKPGEAAPSGEVPPESLRKLLQEFTGARPPG